MACTHPRIKSVNCVISCEVCGEILPIDYLVAKDRIAEQKAAEPAEPQEKAVKKTTVRKKVK